MTVWYQDGNNVPSFALQVVGGGTHQTQLDVATLVGTDLPGFGSKKLQLNVTEDLLSFDDNRLSAGWTAVRDLVLSGRCDVIDTDGKLYELTPEECTRVGARFNEVTHQTSIRDVTLLSFVSHFNLPISRYKTPPQPFSLNPLI